MFTTLLTECAPCAKDGLTRRAIDVIDDVPVCGACAYEVRTFRLAAEIDADESALTRRPGLPVPAMAFGEFPTPVE
jgi:hypothetical protein